MTKDEALDLALETLESIQAAFPCETVGKRIAAIKQARSAPVQEPCTICGATDHKETCDSPGAIITKTTGCPVHDKTATPPAAPVQEPVADAMARYLRVCSSGGMPKKLQESVQNLVYDAERLGYFKAATPPAAPVPEMVFVPYEPCVQMQEQGSAASDYDLSQSRSKRVYQAMLDMHQSLKEKGQP